MRYKSPIVALVAQIEVVIFDKRGDIYYIYARFEGGFRMSFFTIVLKANDSGGIEGFRIQAMKERALRYLRSF